MKNRPRRHFLLYVQHRKSFCEANISSKCHKELLLTLHLEYWPTRTCIYTVPLTKIVTKSTFVQRSRSNHTFESIGSVSIISQSSSSPISSFTCRSFNRLNNSYCFIDPSFHKNMKMKNGRNSQKCTKDLMRFIYLFIQIIYLFI